MSDDPVKEPAPNMAQLYNRARCKEFISALNVVRKMEVGGDGAQLRFPDRDEKHVYVIDIRRVLEPDDE